jgi:hypothetical protein
MRIETGIHLFAQRRRIGFGLNGERGKHQACGEHQMESAHGNLCDRGKAADRSGPATMAPAEARLVNALSVAS